MEDKDFLLQVVTDVLTKLLGMIMSFLWLQKVKILIRFNQPQNNPMYEELNKLALADAAKNKLTVFWGDFEYHPVFERANAKLQMCIREQNLTKKKMVVVSLFLCIGTY